jgi:adenylate cyclase
MMDRKIGRFVLQPFRILLDGQGMVPIGSKALDLLSVLAEADGAVVTKDELMAAIWPNVIVEENTIQVHASALRKILGEEANRLIAVRGRGYRLKPSDTDSQIGEHPVSEQAGLPLIAVLSFENQSDDPNLGNFARGVSEEILDAVRRISGVRVCGRSSSLPLQGALRQTSAVGIALGASHILDGSVRRQGSHFRINAQLVEVAGGTLLWCDRFDGVLDDIFAVQDSIAAAVAQALSQKFMSRMRVGPENPLAYDLYIEGRQLAGELAGQAMAVPCFEKAAELAPDFADAWACLAVNLAIHIRWGPPDGDVYAQIERAKTALRRALELDPNSATAHGAVAALEPYAHYQAYECHVKRALTLSLYNPETLLQRSFFLYVVGRIGEAHACVEQALRLDMLNQETVNLHASLLYEMGSVLRASKSFALARKRWPDSWWFFLNPFLRAVFARDWDVVDDMLSQSGANHPELAMSKFVAHLIRNPDSKASNEVLVAAERQLAETGQVSLAQLILIYELGLHDDVFSFVERASFERYFAADGNVHDMVGFFPGIIFGTTNVAMRRDPRFVILCGKLGLCHYWVESGHWPDCANERAIDYDFEAAARNYVAGNALPSCPS